MLIPVLDNEKHYWVGRDELEKLLRKGEGWLKASEVEEVLQAAGVQRPEPRPRDVLAAAQEVEARQAELAAPVRRHGIEQGHDHVSAPRIQRRAGEEAAERLDEIGLAHDEGGRPSFSGRSDSGRRMGG